MSSHSSHGVSTKETKPVPLTIVHGETIYQQVQQPVQHNNHIIAGESALAARPPPVRVSTQPSTIPADAKCFLCERGDVSLSMVPKSWLSHHNVQDDGSQCWGCFSCCH